MKTILRLLAILALSASAFAGELKPLPDMASSTVPTGREAADIVLKEIMADPDDGLSAMESVVAKLAFALGRDIPSFGKKGERVWQVHRSSLGQTISIIWVNAETKATHTIMEKAEQTESTVPSKAAPSASSDVR